MSFIWWTVLTPSHGLTATTREWDNPCSTYPSFCVLHFANLNWGNTYPHLTEHYWVYWEFMFVKHFEILGWKVLLKCKILWLLDIIIPCTVFYYKNSTVGDSQIGWQHFKLHCCLPINFFYFDVRSNRYPRAIIHYWHKNTWQMWLLGKCHERS